MDRETDNSKDMEEYRKHWNDMLNVEGERRAVLKELYFRTEILWRLMREKYAVTDSDLLSKLDTLKRKSVYPDQGIPVTCSACGRAYSIRDTLRPACTYCGNIPSGIEGQIPFDGASLFAPFPEWLRGTDLWSMSKTADISFGSAAPAATTNDFHPAASVLKGFASLVIPFSGSIASIVKADSKRTGGAQTLDKSDVNYAPILQRYCSVLLSIWEIFREKTDTGAVTLAEEVFRLLDKLAAELVPSEHRPPFEYLSVLTDAIRNLFIAAASLTDADFTGISDSLAETRAASKENQPAPICRVCGRPIQSIKSGPVACIYCGTKIEQDPAAYLFQVRFD
jgi:DNA-directed RNA polymerase subunit RPC12/RpoP